MNVFRVYLCYPNYSIIYDAYISLELPIYYLRKRLKQQNYIIFLIRYKYIKDNMAIFYFLENPIIFQVFTDFYNHLKSKYLRIIPYMLQHKNMLSDERI